MNQRKILKITTALAIFLCGNAFATTSLRTVEGNSVDFSEFDAEFVSRKFAAHLDNCELVEDRYNERPVLTLDLPVDNASFQIMLLNREILDYDYKILNQDRESFNNCSRSHISPVLALMLDYEYFIEDENENALQQDIPVEVLRFRRNTIAKNLNLTSHEPNQMLGRMDSNDISRLYMDFNLSLKHPVLTKVLDPLFEMTGINSDRRYAQLYFAFSGHFSQYIGSRASSPVVSRRFNPELFLRVWNTQNGHWDIGYGHESNGQQINNQFAFEEEELNYINKGQDGVFARDGISRGWDYVSLDWKRVWERNRWPILDGDTVTELEFRRFLSNGLLQGRPEEYNEWERNGGKERPRDRYDGLSLSFQYWFTERQCVLIELFCLNKLELTQTTGYAKLFDHNTSTLELTADVLGLPLQIWAKSGYNSDLVDYYDYSNSWGIGLEFLSD
jgi:outer membrane phospholipase A